MPIEATDIDKIKDLIDDRFDRMEVKLSDDINKLAVKVDNLSDKYHDTSDRVTKLETVISVCDNSRSEQGKRIGELEKIVAVMNGSHKTEKEVKQNTGQWARFVVPLIISGIMFLGSFIFWFAGVIK